MGGGDSSIIVVEDEEEAIRIIKRVMGERHAYYALEALRALEESTGLVARVNGRSVGSVVAYIARGSGRAPSLGIIYYVAVLPQYRGRGYGKVLVASAEEILESSGSEVFVSTIEASNEASINLFRSLGYATLSLEDAREVIGMRAVLGVLHAACSYEDDIIALKGDDFEAKLVTVDEDSYRDVWWKTCYKPWLKRWYRL